MERELEQRVKALEDDLKLLKNEVQQILLDIKEQLMLGGVSPVPQQPARGVQGMTERQERTGAIAREEKGIRAENHQDASVTLSAITALGGWLADKVKKLGTDNVIAILELYGLSGQLPASVKEILVQFVRSHKHYEGSPLSPQDYVVLFQELDSIIKGKTKGENALLSLLHLGEESGEGQKWTK